MSVLIKGMKMPISCHECVAGYGGCCFVASAESDGICPDNGRADFCPLVPVPPHGRLIDADALGIRGEEKRAYEAYLREKNEFFREEPLLEYHRGRLDGLVNASGLVRFAPTIIPAEEGE